MVLKAAIWIIVVVIVIGVVESILNRLKRDNEATRKLLHIMHAVGLAGLAFIIPLYWVAALELFFLVSVLLARYLHIHYDKQWKWVHYLGKTYRVGRESYGEILMPIGLILVAIVANSEWEFAATVLIMGLADAAAALVGKKWGASTSYDVFGQKKSLLGSTAFFVVALAVLLAYGAFAPDYPGNVLPLLAVAAFLTGIENVGVYGTDNLLLPIASIWMLNLL